MHASRIHSLEHIFAERRKFCDAHPSLLFPEGLTKPCVSFEQHLETCNDTYRIHISLVYKRHLCTSMGTLRDHDKHPLSKVVPFEFDFPVHTKRSKKDYDAARVRANSFSSLFMQT